MNGESRNRTLLIHLSTDSVDAALCGSASARPSWCLHDQSILTWYCEWARHWARHVYVLLPEPLKDQSDRISQYVSGATALWYADDGLTTPLPHGGREWVWVVNGHYLPMVDWGAANAVVRRRRCDVLLFGQAGTSRTHRYPESVVVSDTGEVLRFKRHYSDSPAFTDVWGEEISLLVSQAKHAPAVVTHLVARGWGLDSVGAMTRRFYVRWSPARCVLWDAAPQEMSRVEAGVDPKSDERNGFPSRAEEPPRIRMQDTDPGGSVVSDDLVRPEPTAPQPNPSPPFTVGRNPPGIGVEEQILPTTFPSDVPTDNRSYLFWKRIMDITLSAVALIGLSPLLLTVALLIKLTSKGPVLFAHKRQGLGGKEFPCLKFRSMRLGADAMQDKLRGQNEVDGPQFKIERDPRLTTVGIWLRRTNIDELPQLLNVLVGHMSLVGPRPSPDQENQLCPAWRRARLSVKPGVTGLWQVLRLRDQEQSDFQEWIYYDIEYARYRSLWLDWQLILYTPISILAPGWVKDLAKQLRRRGICQFSARLVEPVRSVA